MTDNATNDVPELPTYEELLSDYLRLVIEDHAKVAAIRGDIHIRHDPDRGEVHVHRKHIAAYDAAHPEQVPPPVPITAALGVDESGEWRVELVGVADVLSSASAYEFANQVATAALVAARLNAGEIQSPEDLGVQLVDFDERPINIDFEGLAHDS